MAQMRVTPELFDLVTRTAEHVGLDVSEVIRSICKSIRRGNVVTQKKIPICVTKGGTKLLSVRGLENPCHNLEEFRRQLAARCLEELARPRPEPYQPNLREGIDYITVDQEE